MPDFEFMQVDAFTTKPLGGNPCAVLFDTAELDDATMLAIAQEMNLSETAFIQESDIADFRFRYFTPSEEIPLAGHPTIASVFALIETGRLNLTESHKTIHVELTAGIIKVDINAHVGQIPVITMSQKRPEFYTVIPKDEVLPVFNLPANALIPDLPIQIVSTGTPQLMIPVNTLEDLKNSSMDFGAYRALKDKYKFFSPHLFCVTGITSAGDTFARHFGLPPDTIEDPFTGSATGGMAAYLWHYGLIETPNFIAEQGHWMNRPGQATVEVVGARDAIETVKVSGTAVKVISGTIHL